MRTRIALGRQAIIGDAQGQLETRWMALWLAWLAPFPVARALTRQGRLVRQSFPHQTQQRHRLRVPTTRRGASRMRTRIALGRQAIIGDARGQLETKQMALWLAWLVLFHVARALTPQGRLVHRPFPHPFPHRPQTQQRHRLNVPTIRRGATRRLRRIALGRQAIIGDARGQLETKQMVLWLA